MFAIVFAISVSIIIAYFWVKGIDNMKKNHPDYKGEDFLNWDKDVTKVAGRDGWDDNRVHTEGDF
jgi:hypothetical protein